MEASALIRASKTDQKETSRSKRRLQEDLGRAAGRATCVVPTPTNGSEQTLLKGPLKQRDVDVHADTAHDVFEPLEAAAHIMSRSECRAA